MRGFPKVTLKAIISSLLLLLFVGGLFLISQEADAYVSVKGYYRKDGTYVRPHMRSVPNALRYDNYGYKKIDRLYNPSYYSSSRNYSSSWYTPAWYTDSTYYLGKSLYNSRYSLYVPSLYRSSYSRSSLFGSSLWNY